MKNNFLIEAGKILSEILEYHKDCLVETVRDLEKLQALVHSARTPKNRTAINIIVDDQKKTIKAIQRTISDISELVDNRNNSQDH